jgi:hypothetical protein
MNKEMVIILKKVKKYLLFIEEHSKQDNNLIQIKIGMNHLNLHLDKEWLLKDGMKDLQA